MVEIIGRMDVDQNRSGAFTCRHCLSRLGLPPIHPVTHQQRRHNNSVLCEVKGDFMR